MTIFEQKDAYLYEIPAGFRTDMRVPARFYASKTLLKHITADKSLDQLINTATLPGIVDYSLAMPDIHQGYGFPIGGVAATAWPDGVISPGGVGYDINCGMRLLGSQLDFEEIKPFLETLAMTIHAVCPSGVGKGGEIRLKAKDLDAILEKGAKWALKKGYADESDLMHTEEKGCLRGADPSQVSERAKKRGTDQVGTLGAGNHFIEIDVVDQVFDETAAHRMGLMPNRIVVQLHTGSRGLGHQVCTDYVKAFQKAIRKYHLNLPDRELVCAPLESPEGKAYLGAMNAAANFAYVNRQVLAYLIRMAFERVLAGKLRHHLYQIYDIAHNIARIETHVKEGRKRTVCVHRKGATRAFGSGAPKLPEAYKDIGQPVLVPGSMGTESWVFVGTQKAMETTFGSACHGAGRRMSRSQAKKKVRRHVLREELARQGIHICSRSMSGLAEEAPLAYKDVGEVAHVVHEAGLTRKVARLRPVAVIKG